MAIVLLVVVTIFLSSLPFSQSHPKTKIAARSCLPLSSALVTVRTSPQLRPYS